MPDKKRLGIRFILVVVAITVLAAWVRLVAVWRLPVDYDELAYLPNAFEYQQMMAEGRWKDVMNFRGNLEHPPLNKLLFALDLEACRPQRPDWEKLEVGRAIPDSDKPAFTGPRMISAVGGVLQVVLTSLANPLAGLLLALDTYHIKYSAQVYLEGVPGLMAVLAVFLFELSVGRVKTDRLAGDPVRTRHLVLSAVALGLAAAGKYLYGIVGPVLLVFLLLRSRSARKAALFTGVALAAFFLADPFLWPSPLARLWESLTFHWSFSHSAHVVSSGMPWYSPFVHLLRSAPTHWHPGVFYTGIADLLILPLALVGLPKAVRERPIWVAWAGFGLFFLVLWPTKWPQYTLLVLPPLAVCGGIGLGWIGSKCLGLLMASVSALSRSRE